MFRDTNTEVGQLNQEHAKEHLRLTLAEQTHTGARIKVMGVGGSGGNAVNRMVQAGFEGVEFVVANTDLQAPCYAAPVEFQSAPGSPKGSGAGADPNHMGARRHRGHRQEVIEALDGADMVFVTTGLGGGTGTGAAPVIASLAGGTRGIALTIAVVAESSGSRASAGQPGGWRASPSCATRWTGDAPNPNERLLATMNGTAAPLPQAFADDVLRQAIQGCSDLILVPGLIDLDFADVKAIMSGMGMAIMGTGVAEGPGTRNRPASPSRARYSRTRR